MLNIIKKYICILLIALPIGLNAQSIFWIDGVSHVIQTSSFNGNGLSNIDTSVGTAFGITADLSNRMLFWVDNTNKAIMSSNLDGTNVNVVVNKAAGDIMIPRGIAVNATAEKIYWTDNGSRTLMSANYDGSNVAVLDTGLDCPGYAVFDSVNQKIYWADNGLGAKKIQRCNIDGSNVQDVVTGLNQVWGIGFDDQTNTIYWIDSGIEKIQKGDVSGTLPVTKIDLITNLSGSQRGLVINEKSNTMYWSSIDGKIMTAHLDGTNEAVVDSGLNYPQGITLIDSLLTFSGVKNTATVPKQFNLFQNYPNPFNPTTTIKYSIAQTSFVTLKVYNILGNEVAALVNDVRKAGDYSVQFGDRNNILASGVYFYRLQATTLNKSRNFVDTKKFILLK